MAHETRVLKVGDPITNCEKLTFFFGAKGVNPFDDVLDFLAMEEFRHPRHATVGVVIHFSYTVSLYHKAARASECTLKSRFRNRGSASLGSVPVPRPGESSSARLPFAQPAQSLALRGRQLLATCLLAHRHDLLAFCTPPVPARFTHLGVTTQNLRTVDTGAARHADLVRGEYASLRTHHSISCCSRRHVVSPCVSRRSAADLVCADLARGCVFAREVRVHGSCSAWYAAVTRTNSCAVAWGSALLRAAADMTSGWQREAASK